MDIGLASANLIYDLDSSALKVFFEYYPVSDYIRDYLRSLRKKVNELMSEMAKEKETSDKANGEVMSQIMMIEEHISSIKDAIVELDNINKTTTSPDWEFTRSKMLEKINTWKIKKTKITSYDEAIKLAEQFEEEVKYQWIKFIEIVSDITIKSKDYINAQCTNIYDKANRSQTIINPCQTSYDSYITSFNGLKEELLKIKEENYEKPKENLINAFLKEIVVANDNKEAILVTSYPCQKWREYVAQVASQIIDKIIKERNEEIREYQSEISLNYMDKLIKLLDIRESDKEDFSKRLSSDIRELQKDSDWLISFSEKLEAIERS